MKCRQDSMRSSLALLFLFTLVGCLDNPLLQSSQFEPTAIRASDFTAPQIAEDTEGTITIANPDRASSCEVTLISNATVTQSCSCSALACTVKVKGTTDYFGPASLKFKLTKSDIVSPEATVTFTISSVFNVTGSLDLSNVSTSKQAKKVSFASLSVDEDVQKVEVCLASTAGANCDVQAWVDVTTATSASGQTTASWNDYHLKSGTHGASFTLQESCLTAEDYFLKVRLTNVTNETSTITSSPIVPWSPACLSSLSLWFDSDDSSTMTLVGSDVSEWRDKSPNANHALQPSAPNRPVLGTNILNGQNVVRFPSWADTFTGTTTGSFQSIISVRNLLATGFQMLFSAPAHSDFSLRAIGHFDGTTTVTYVFNPNSNDWVIGDPTKFWVNGTQTTDTITDYHIVAAASVAPQNTTYSISSDFMNRGLDNNSGVAELIVTNTIFTTTDRQKLEGYLAHKWGLSGNLPLAHPYKTTPP